MYLEIKNHPNNIVEYRVFFDDFFVSFLNLGATIYEIGMRNHLHKFENIVLSYDKPTDYLKNQMYLGTTVGLYAGRIANSTFEVDGVKYQLESNEGTNFLHGGVHNLSHVLFDLEVSKVNNNEVILIAKTRFPISNENKWTDVRVVYTISNLNLKIEYFANSNTTWFCNLTNHTYFNLTGDSRNLVSKHHLKTNLKQYWATDQNQIPIKPSCPPELISALNTGTTLKDLLDICKKSEGLNDNLDNFLEIEDSFILDLPSKKRRVTFTSSSSTLNIYDHNGGLDRKVRNWPAKTPYLGLAIEFQNIANDVNRKDPKSILKPNDEYYQWVNIAFTDYRKSFSLSQLLSSKK